MGAFLAFDGFSIRDAHTGLASSALIELAVVVVVTILVVVLGVVVVVVLLVVVLVVVVVVVVKVDVRSGGILHSSLKPYLLRLLNPSK